MVQPEEFHITRRPDLAYQYAFDWLAVQLHGISGHAACLVPGLFCGSEMLRRLPTVAFLDPVPSQLARVCRELGWHGVVTAEDSTPLSAVAWIEPRSKDVEQLGFLADRLAPNGRLYIVTGGPLARFLVENRRTKRSFLPAGRIEQQLLRYNLQLTATVGVHGLSAVFWHYLGQLSVWLDRRDWRDRCNFAMRRDLLINGRNNSVAALRFLTIQRLT